MQRHGLPAASHESDINPTPPTDNEQANSSFPWLGSNGAGEKWCMMTKLQQKHFHSPYSKAASPQLCLGAGMSAEVRGKAQGP